jgi:tetratricopeptide (TPR) repeat protein
MADDDEWVDEVNSAREDVARDRQLVALDRETHLSGLALSLNHLSVWLSGQQGREEECLNAAVESTNLYRELADRGRDTPEHSEALNSLAWSLDRFAYVLSDLGRPQEALDAVIEATALFRQVTELNREGYLRNLAGSVEHLAKRLSEAGRRSEAAAATGEAVALFRELADFYDTMGRDDYLIDWAVAVDDLTDQLDELGRPGEALDAAIETVTVWRSAVNLDRECHLPDLARCLYNLAIKLGDASRHAEGLDAATEAVRLYRELADLDRHAHLPDLARGLDNLAIDLDEAGRGSEALDASIQAATVYRELTDLDRDAHIADMAQSVLALAARLAEAQPADDDRVWSQIVADLPTSWVLSWRTLRAGWDWITAEDYASEQAQLSAHAPYLLAPGSEDWLTHVLANQPDDETERYLTLITSARDVGVDTAYQRLLTDWEPDG